MKKSRKLNKDDILNHPALQFTNTEVDTSDKPNYWMVMKYPPSPLPNSKEEVCRKNSLNKRVKYLEELLGTILNHDSSDEFILSNIKLDLKDIAEAPLYLYTCRKDKSQKFHVGTSSKYWDYILKGWFTHQLSEDKFQTDIINLSLAISISLAKDMLDIDSGFNDIRTKNNSTISLIRKLIGRIRACRDQVNVKCDKLRSQCQLLNVRVKELERFMDSVKGSGDRLTKETSSSDGILDNWPTTPIKGKDYCSDKINDEFTSLLKGN